MVIVLALLATFALGVFLHYLFAFLNGAPTAPNEIDGDDLHW